MRFPDFATFLCYHLFLLFFQPTCQFPSGAPKHSFNVVTPLFAQARAQAARSRNSRSVYFLLRPPRLLSSFGVRLGFGSALQIPFGRCAEDAEEEKEAEKEAEDEAVVQDDEEKVLVMMRLPNAPCTGFRAIFLFLHWTNSSSPLGWRLFPLIFDPLLYLPYYPRVCLLVSLIALVCLFVSLLACFSPSPSRSSRRDCGKRR